MFGPLGEDDNEDNTSTTFVAECLTELSSDRPGQDEANLATSQISGRHRTPPSWSNASNRSDRKETCDYGRQSRDDSSNQDPDHDGGGNEQYEDDNGSDSDPNDEDYADCSDAVDPETEEQGRPTKLRRRGKITERFGTTATSVSEEPLLTNGIADSGRDVGAVSFCVTKENDAILICGFLPPKALESKIVFSFIISQDPFSESFITAHTHAGIGGSRGKPLPSYKHMSGQSGGRLLFSSEKNVLFVKLKEKKG